MLLTGQCLACGRMVSNENASRITKLAIQPVYCMKCEDAALAHLMSYRMDKAIEHMRNLDLANDVDQALQLLIRRLRGSFESLRALLKAGLFTANHHDPATILRAMYEAALQAEYIAHDEVIALSMAQKYLDFQEIERHRLIRALGKYREEFAARNEPEVRESNEIKIKERFEKVEARFRRSGGPGYITAWHEEKLRDFYKTKGLKEEYDFMLVLLHGAAHTSSLAMLRGYSISPSFLMLSAANVVWRAIGAMLDYHKIEPDTESAGLIANARKSLLELFRNGEAANLPTPASSPAANAPPAPAAAS